MHNLPDLVIFDCDGVLVDSEPISNRVLADLLTEIGLPTTFEQSLQLFLGKSWKDNFLIIQERLGKSPPQDLYEIYTKRMYQAFEAELKPISGIESSLDQIALKTMIRSNPGIFLIEEGIVSGKWHWRDLPSDISKIIN